MDHPEKVTEDGFRRTTPFSSGEEGIDQESEHQRVPQQMTAVDWTNPDDEENPENWSLTKKAYHTSTIGLQCFIAAFGTSVYSPFVPLVAAHFHISEESAILPLTVYVLGLAFGPVISAPLSETYGRKIVYFVVFPVSLLFTLGAGLAHNFGTLLVCRFFAGAVGGGVFAIGAGSNSDLNPPIHRSLIQALLLVASFAGPAIGPAVGGYVAEFESWRWSQWVILMVGLFATIVALFQEETYKKIILQRRAKRLNLSPPPNPLASLSAAGRIKVICTITIFRPIRMILTEPIVAFFGLYTGFNFGVLFAFFACFPLIFTSPYPEIQVYHFNSGESGLVFLGIGLGVIIAFLIYMAIDRWYYVPKAMEKVAAGADDRSLLLPPEQRMYAAMIGSLMLPIGLFWFAWTARSSIHWIVPILATVFFGAGNVLVFFSSTLYQIDTYGANYSASAIAANGITRYVFGGTFPLFAIQMYRSLGVGWATSLLGFVTVALLPLPWILFKYGPTIRKRSAYTRSCI